MAVKPVVLVVMDGVGFSKTGLGDAVSMANTPTLDKLLKECPNTSLKAHGDAVGLPSDDDMGNSEVGHNALGCGQIYSQGAKLVNECIDELIESGKIEEILTKYKTTDLVFYESPNRILKTLEVISQCRPSATTVIGRELTKIFEEVLIDKTENIIKYFQTNPLKGEIVAAVLREKISVDNADIEEKISALKTKGYTAKDISIILSTLYKFNKNDIYQKSLN